MWGKLFHRQTANTKKLAASDHTFKTPHASQASLFANSPAQKVELEDTKECINHDSPDTPELVRLR